jgi:ABC-type glycerol-3-phosphate transport system substrate-binding protein
MHKPWTKLAPVVALALIIASCGAAATPPPAPLPSAQPPSGAVTATVQAVAEPAKVETVKLTYISQAVWWSAEFYNTAEKQLFKQFEDTHPGISLAIGPTQSAFAHVFLENNAKPPDIIADTFETFPAIRRGMILDISDIWQDQDLAKAFPADLRALGEWDGKQYYMPIFTSWTAIY